MQTIERRSSWNFIDTLLSKWRAKFIIPYLRPDSVVCDVGCGQEGRILVSIADRIKEGYGFDFNLKAGSAPRDNIHLSNADFLTVGKRFDVVILLAVIEHLPYPEAAETMLEGICTKLNPGGVLIMTTPDKRAKRLLEFLAYRLHVINEEEIRDHKHYFDKTELVSFSKVAGFGEVHHRHFQLGLNNLVICRK